MSEKATIRLLSAARRTRHDASETSGEPSRGHELAGLARGAVPHRGRQIASVFTLLIVAFIVQGLARNGAFEWSTAGDYLFNPRVLSGVVVALEVTAMAMILGLVLAVVLANMRLSPNRVLAAASRTYVWFFRSIPTIVLLILVYNLALLYPQISFGIPFGPEFVTIGTAHLISPLAAGVLAFGLQQAAFTSEMIRAAILAVPPGQREAATTIGMTPFQAAWHIVLPQAFRIAIPPLSNDTINMLKATSLLSVIAVSDITYSVEQIYAVDYRVIPLLMVACAWYAALVTLLTIAQSLIERRLKLGKRPVLGQLSGTAPIGSGVAGGLDV